MDNGASSYRRFLDGDETAFREIVQAYFDHLVFFIDRYVHDYAAAEDIALDTFTQLIVNKHRYNFKVELKTYLFMVGRSRALDYIKHRNKISFIPLTEISEIEAEGASLEEIVLSNERKRAVNRALEQLPEEMRIVIHLVYFEGLNCENAANVMKKNKKQVYNLLFRAKNALRIILGEEAAMLC